MIIQTSEKNRVSHSSVCKGVDSAMGEKPELSVIIPVYNEEESLNMLYEKVVASLDSLGKVWELILIDDGSTDNSWSIIEEIAKSDNRVKALSFVKNFGQTAALAAGIDEAAGSVFIPMDADLQNDPVDIQRLLDKLDEGFDVVSGWRKDRKDNFLTRLVPSWAANALISWISGVKLHDYGCSLKAYRRHVLKDVRLYGEMHRFVPIYASWVGAKVTEIPVSHHARELGQSKYGISRTFKVILDLCTVKFLSSYATKPIYVFGTCGFLACAASILIFIWMVVLKYGYNTSFVETPLPVLVAMFFMVGVQLILMGLLAELLMRTYHESQGKRIYTIKSSVNSSNNNSPSIN